MTQISILERDILERERPVKAFLFFLPILHIVRK